MMKKIKAFDFEITKLSGPSKMTCKFITNTNDSITFFGDTVEDIFEQCISRFPEGLETKGIIFSGIDKIDAKKNLSELLSLGFRTGYFKNHPLQNYEGEE